MSSHRPPFPKRFYLILAILLLLAAALQPRIAPGLIIYNVSPNLVLMVAVAGALADGPATGAWLGFLGAYLVSVPLPFSPGAQYFSHIVTGYFSGLVQNRLFTQNPLVPAGVGFLAGLASESLFYLLSPRSPLLWLEGAAVQSIYGLLLTPLIYFLLNSQAGKHPEWPRNWQDEASRS